MADSPRVRGQPDDHRVGDEVLHTMDELSWENAFLSKFKLVVERSKFIVSPERCPNTPFIWPLPDWQSEYMPLNGSPQAVVDWLLAMREALGIPWRSYWEMVAVAGKTSPGNQSPAEALETASKFEPVIESILKDAQRLLDYLERINKWHSLPYFDDDMLVLRRASNLRTPRGAWKKCEAAEWLMTAARWVSENTPGGIMTQADGKRPYSVTVPSFTPTEAHVYTSEIAAAARHLLETTRRCAPVYGRPALFSLNGKSAGSARSELDQASYTLECLLDPANGGPNNAPIHFYCLSRVGRRAEETELLKLWELFWSELRGWGPPAGRMAEPEIRAIDPRVVGALQTVVENLAKLAPETESAVSLSSEAQTQFTIIYSVAIESPREWAKIFGFRANRNGSREFMARVKDLSIRVERITSRKYRVAVDDLPPSHPESPRKPVK